MTPTECEFEAQALAAATEGCAEPALREHVLRCPICAEVVALSNAFALTNQQSLTAAASLPDPSRVWWMAQVRARREATQDAVRPILATQIATFAWAIGLLIVCLGVAFAWFRSAFSLATAVLLSHGVLVAIAAAVVVLLPTAAYFALGKE